MWAKKERTDARDIDPNGFSMDLGSLSKVALRESNKSLVMDYAHMLEASCRYVRARREQARQDEQTNISLSVYANRQQ